MNRVPESPGDHTGDGLTGPEFKAVTYRELARVGKAVADATRLELLDLLCQSEKNVDWLSKELNMSVATTSHHLQILKTSKLVATRKEGRFVFYRATRAGMAAWKSLVDIGEESLAEIRWAVASFFDKEEELQAVDFSELQDLVKRNEVLLADVRPPDEYSAGHFPGAISLPLKELEQRMAALPKGIQIVAYCRGPFCVLSKEAVEALRRHGITAYRLAAGVVDWRMEGNSVDVDETGQDRNVETAG